MGEISVSAFSNGERLTLDPILPVQDLVVRPRRVRSSIPAGFRTEWIDGTIEETGHHVTLLSGAGFGSAYMILEVKDAEGKTIAEEVVDMREVILAWYHKMHDEGMSSRD